MSQLGVSASYRSSNAIIAGMNVLQAEAMHQLPDLKKMLKLYTSISTCKLAGLLHTDISTLTAALHNMQRRIVQKRWVAGDAASGQVLSALHAELSLSFTTCTVTDF